MNYLTRLIEKLIRFLPRPVIITEPERGVFLRCGKVKTRWYLSPCRWHWHQKWIKPGIYLCLPYIDQIEKVVVVTQILNLPNQSVTTRDGYSMGFSGGVEYSIEDPYIALMTILDYDVALQTLIMGIILKQINQREKAQCVQMEDLMNEIGKKVRVVGKKWGLVVTRFWLTDGAEHKVYRIMSHDMPAPIIIGEQDG